MKLLREEVSLQKHDGEIRSLAFSHDGKYLASGGADGTVKVWDNVAKEKKAEL